ncbi:MAG: HEPN domain-containing protein [Bacteroidetes bacterium]|nr:HEPN domain-containing protein [Bacteroidota bacterium]
MNKQQHIVYWLESAEKDWEVMNYLMKGRKYVHALFFGHLYLEKLAKALWVKSHKENYPPKIHNLVRILDLSEIKLDDNDMEFLDVLNWFQIEGRYPDYVNNLVKETTKHVAEQYVKQIKSISKCLKEKLQ